jgi:hypothetical protein
MFLLRIATRLCCFVCIQQHSIESRILKMQKDKATSAASGGGSNTTVNAGTHYRNMSCTSMFILCAPVLTQQF